MINRTSLALFFGAGMAGSFLAACGDASPSLHVEPTVYSIPVVRAGSDIRLPLDEYLLSDQQVQLIVRAQNVLVRRCMRHFGFDWPPRLPPRKSATAAIDNSRRYYVADEQVARTDGYHAPEGFRPQAAPQQGEAAPTADVMRIWTGHGPQRYRGHTVPQQGCAGEASRAMQEGPADASIDAQQLQLGTLARSRRDSRVLAVNIGWRKCMELSGYSFADPRTANNDPRWQQSRTPSTVEIATAVADVRCKQQTNLPGVMMAVESAYQRIVIAERSGDLARLKKRSALLVATASRIGENSQ
jgi:hypothetical protein